MARRANERYMEIEAELEVADVSVSKPADGGKRSQNPRAPVQQQEVRRDFFGEILQQVEVLQGKGVAVDTIMALERNQFHEDLLEAHRPNAFAYDVYRIPLPTKPGIVSVQLERNWETGQEGTLCCYASTDCSNPTAQNHQLHGETGIEYTHAFKVPVEAENGGFIDRRKVVPNKKNLFLSVDFSRRDLTVRYRIRYTLSKITIALTEEEFREKPRVAPMRQWEKRIIDIKQDREKLDAFNNLLQQRVDEEKERVRKLDVVKLNRSMPSPVIKYKNHCLTAVKNCQHEEEVQSRKAAIDDDLAQRRVDWLHRAEARRVREAAKREQQQFETEQHQRRELWFRYLFLNTCTLTMATRFATKQDEIKVWFEKNFATKTIQRCWFVKHAPRRRHKMYRDVLKFRAGMTAYIRTIRVAYHVGASSILAGFLSGHVATSFNPRATITRFIKNIRLIQKHWRRLKMVRFARMEVYYKWWRQIEESLINSRSLSKERANGPDPQGSLKSPAPAGTQSLNINASAQKGINVISSSTETAGTQSMDNSKLRRAGSQWLMPVPDVVVKKTLLKFIKSQMLQWAQAFAEHKAQVTSLEAQVANVVAEGHASTIEAVDLNVGAPRSSLVVASGVMEDLVSTTLLDFKAGKLNNLLDDEEEGDKTALATLAKRTDAAHGLTDRVRGKV